MNVDISVWKSGDLTLVEIRHHFKHVTVSSVNKQDVGIHPWHSQSLVASKVEIPNGAVDALLTSGAKCGGTVLGVAKLPLCPTGVLIENAAASGCFFCVISISISVALCYVSMCVLTQKNLELNLKMEFVHRPLKSTKVIMVQKAVRISMR